MITLSQRRQGGEPINSLLRSQTCLEWEAATSQAKECSTKACRARPPHESRPTPHPELRDAVSSFPSACRRLTALLALNLASINVVYLGNVTWERRRWA